MSRATSKSARRAEPPKLPGLVYVQPLGSGGYADVYLYEQQSPRMPVAVKVLKGEGLTSSLRAQFTAEADTMAQLGDHPYIVQVFRAGVSEDGRPFLVMKYYPGQNLAARARVERFSVEEVLRTGIQLASAIETAHRAGIIHRDIKPANVLVSTYGAPGLTDFGIAGRGGAAAAEGGHPDEAAETDDIGVSVPWAPPEVLYGQSNGSVRADVYSLAASLWQLLVGRSPFEVPGGDNSAFALMPRIRSQAMPSTGRQDVPPSLERLLAQAMAKDPAVRPSSALELARALQAIEQEQRMNRTPIVVLDERGETTLVAQPGSVGGDDDDRTRVKATTIHGAQAPVEADEETRRREETRWAPQPSGPSSMQPTSSGAPAASSSTSSATASSAAAASTGALGGVPIGSTPGQWGPAGSLSGSSAGSVRPVPVTEPTSSATSPYGPADEHTVKRVEGTAASTRVDESLTPRSGLSPTVVWGLVGAVVVLVGLVAFLLLRPGGGETPSTPSNSPTVKTSVTDGPVVPASMFEPPTVVADAKTGAVEFRWTYPSPAKGDTFRVWVGADANKALEAGPKVIGTPELSVPAKKGTTLCALVVVERSGIESPKSAPMCETAL